MAFPEAIEQEEPKRKGPSLAILVKALEKALAANPDLLPQEQYKVPTGGYFMNPDMSERDFLPAPDLQTIAERLISECPEFEHLPQYQIAYLWKRVGGEKHGQETLGACVKASGLPKHFSEATWIIWLAADHLFACTRQQVEAVLHHELLHAGEMIDKEGEKKPAIIGHDFEAFAKNIERYGAWNESLKLCRNVWQQTGLFGD